MSIEIHATLNSILYPEYVEKFEKRVKELLEEDKGRDKEDSFKNDFIKICKEKQGLEKLIELYQTFTSE